MYIYRKNQSVWIMIHRYPKATTLYVFAMNFKFTSLSSSSSTTPQTLSSSHSDNNKLRVKALIIIKWVFPLPFYSTARSNIYNIHSSNAVCLSVFHVLWLMLLLKWRTKINANSLSLKALAVIWFELTLKFAISTSTLFLGTSHPIPSYHQPTNICIPRHSTTNIIIMP